MGTVLLLSEVIIHMETYTKIWIDVETNPSSGCSFLLDMITRVKYHNKKCGIYASAYMWQNILGKNIMYISDI